MDRVFSVVRSEQQWVSYCRSPADRRIEILSSSSVGVDESMDKIKMGLVRSRTIPGGARIHAFPFVVSQRSYSSINTISLHFYFDRISLYRSRANLEQIHDAFVERAARLLKIPDPSPCLPRMSMRMEENDEYGKRSRHRHGRRRKDALIR